MVADDVGLGRAWETKTEGEVDHRIAHFSLRRQSIAGLLKMHFIFLPLKYPMQQYVGRLDST